MTPRTPEALERVVAELDPAGNPKYSKRDVTGDGIDETFCNIFLFDALEKLGVAVPRMRANDFIDWLHGQPARADGWEYCTASTAALRAALGFPTVPCVKGLHHGHVALCMPPRVSPGLFIAQAGNTNFAHRSLRSGFGDLQPEFWTHP